MLTAHRTVAFLVLAGTWGAAIFAGLAYYRRREPRGLVTHLIALAQTLLIAQVGLGLLLSQRPPPRAAPPPLPLRLAVACSPCSRRGSTRRPTGARRLAWFAGATLVAGALAVRAYMTGT